MVPYTENQKWGYKQGQHAVIAAEYDTAYAFDKTNRIAMVGNKSKINKEVNPMTGEEAYSYDFYFIDPRNKKIKILAERVPDSVSTFSHQQELQFNYRDSSGCFKILFKGKVYLLSKNGRQLSGGFDNITETKATGYFEVENSSKGEKTIERVKGLIDSTGFQVVKCKYHSVKINREDSSVYCCSAVFDARLNDDVFNYRGKLIYSSQKHIEFSSKTLHIIKSYTPREEFIIDNALTGNMYYLDGKHIFYLQKNKAVLITKDNWYLIDLLTQKKQKLDKAIYSFMVNELWLQI
ncbi:MAG: hypothetical protein V4580_16525 [Bacteroidota bacterium]